MFLTSATEDNARLALSIVHGEAPKDNEPRIVYETQPLQDRRWHKFVSEHAGASVYHSIAWLTALRAAYGYEPIALSTSHPSEPLTNALLICCVKSGWTGRRIVSVPFSDHCAILASDTTDVQFLLVHLKLLVNSGMWQYAEVRPSGASHLDPSYGFQKVVNYYFHRIDLRQSEKALFKQFHRGCIQRRIKHAEREGVTYEEGNSERLLSRFYRLLVISRKRKGLPPQPFRWFRALSSSFGDHLKIRVASHNNTPVASIITLSCANQTTYKYGCSDHRYKKFGAIPSLMWKAIQEARGAGCEVFDMGRADTDNGGLIAFKDRWGAERSLGAYWRYPHGASSTLTASKLRIAKHIFRSTPKSLLVVVGGLLYRHIG